MGAVAVGSGGLAGAGLVGALTSVVVPARRSRAKTPRVRSVLPGARSGASEVKARTLPSAESDGSVTDPFALGDLLDGAAVEAADLDVAARAAHDGVREHAAVGGELRVDDGAGIGRRERLRRGVRAVAQVELRHRLAGREGHQAAVGGHGRIRGEATDARAHRRRRMGHEVAQHDARGGRARARRSARLVTAVKATKRPSAESRGS